MRGVITGSFAAESSMQGLLVYLWVEYVESQVPESSSF